MKNNPQELLSFIGVEDWEFYYMECMYDKLIRRIFYSSRLARTIAMKMNKNPKQYPLPNAWSAVYTLLSNLILPRFRARYETYTARILFTLFP